MKLNKLIYLIILALVSTVTLSGCKGVSMATANAQFERGEYFEAQKNYRKIYNSLRNKEQRELKAQAAYMSGLCYYRLNQPSRAVNTFKNSLRYGDPEPDVYLYLAESLKRLGKTKEAQEYFDEYLKVDSTSAIAKAGIEGLWMKDNPDNKMRYVVKEAKFINGRRSDFSPAVASKDFDQIFFTSTNELAVGNTKSGVTGMKNGDVWVVKRNEHGKWIAAQPVEGELNSEFDEGVISFTPDGNTMYLTRALRSADADKYVEIWKSRRSDAQWSAPVKVDFDGDSLHNYGHPAVSTDGRYLYFSSDRPGGFGGYDIWRMNLEDRGTHIENLGPEINTKGNEFFPYVRNDSTIYFASDGHPGFGGLDIFKAEISPLFTWSVKNMGMPVNSSYDDFGIVFTEGENGYLSSNRGDERGYDHVYTFELPDINISVSGYIMDPEEYIIPGAAVRIIGNDGSNRRERARDDGSFSFTLDRGVSYILQATADGYLNANQHFTSDMEEADAEYIIDFTLAPVNKPIIIDNIFYDFDKATLRPESKTALDSLVNILEQFPNITIELSSHTDRVGSDRYNDNLSLRRAQSVIDYLINEGGIDSRRLTSQGYGKKRPMTVTPRLAKAYPEFEEGTVLTPEFIEGLEDKQQREDADQINRRTEFEITSVDFYLY